MAALELVRGYVWIRMESLTVFEDIIQLVYQEIWRPSSRNGIEMKTRRV